MDDLEAFLENIEQSASQAEEEGGQNRCTQCNEVLEETEDAYVCPSCGYQASNLLLTEETDIYDIGAQPLQLHRLEGMTKKKHIIDYGWAWSTDEAVVDILHRQLSKLEEYKLVPLIFFRKALRSLWLKYWASFVAPYIQDSYREQDLIPIETLNSLRYRDLDVLVKVQDRVMIPERSKNNIKTTSSSRPYKMLGHKFYSQKPKEASCNGSSSGSSLFKANGSDISQMLEQNMTISNGKSTSTINGHIISQDSGILLSGDIPEMENQTQKSLVSNPTRNLNLDSISLLTLNRTLAFIEATARALNLNIFASDIIRLVNHRSIPFYGAHRFLPDHVKLNYKDRLMFQKSRSPTPLQLTRAACLLLNKVYEEKRPFTIPVPNLDKILARFIIDLNLPYVLKNKILRCINFDMIKQTRPTLFSGRTKNIKHIPQYDRWAFAIIFFYIMKFFPTECDELDVFSETIQKRSKHDKRSYFDPKKWLSQLRLRLDLITRYDPYILLHPIVMPAKVESTPQLYVFLARILEDQVEVTTKKGPTDAEFDPAFREELAQFLKDAIPHPEGLSYKQLKADKKLAEPQDIKHPIIDSLLRTRKFWMSNYEHKPDLWNLLHESFASNEVLSSTRSTECLFDKKLTGNTPLEVKSSWPESIKLLLDIGGFLCYCQPKELLREIKVLDVYNLKSKVSDSDFLIDWL